MAIQAEVYERVYCRLTVSDRAGKGVLCDLVTSSSSAGSHMGLFQ